MSLSDTAKDNLHTPIYLEIVLEAFYFGTLVLDSDSRKKFYDKAIKDDLIQKASPQKKAGGKLQADEVSVELTDKGKAFVKMLLNTPLPVVQTRFVDPRFADA